MKKMFAILFLIVMLSDACATWVSVSTAAVASLKAKDCGEEENKGFQKDKEYTCLATLIACMDVPATGKWCRVQHESFPRPHLDKHNPPPDAGC